MTRSSRPVLVSHHAVDTVGPDPPPDDDHRNLLGDRGDRSRRQARAHEDDAVRPVFEEPPHRRQFGLAAVAAGSEHEAVALRVRSFDEAVERLGEERVVQVIEEHGDHPGLPAGEAPRHRVRRVPQLAQLLPAPARDARR